MYRSEWACPYTPGWLFDIVAGLREEAEKSRDADLGRYRRACSAAAVLTSRKTRTLTITTRLERAFREDKPRQAQRKGEHAAVLKGGPVA